MVSMLPSNLFLIGFSGSGKSTIGPMLAKRLKAEYFDTDAIIENDTGLNIAEIFRRDGEARFRKLEQQTIRTVLQSKARHRVIALGGGAFANSSNRSLIIKSGVVVYLSCPVRELYRRLRLKSDRPLLNVRPLDGETERQAKLRKIRKMLDQREKSYNMAHVRISTANKRTRESVSEVCQKVRKYNARTSS